MSAELVMEGRTIDEDGNDRYVVVVETSNGWCDNDNGVVARIGASRCRVVRGFGGGATNETFGMNEYRKENGETEQNKLV